MVSLEVHDQDCLDLEPFRAPRAQEVEVRSRSLPSLQCRPFLDHRPTLQDSPTHRSPEVAVLWLMVVLQSSTGSWPVRDQPHKRANLVCVEGHHLARVRLSFLSEFLPLTRVWRLVLVFVNRFRGESESTRMLTLFLGVVAVVGEGVVGASVSLASCPATGLRTYECMD